MPETTNLKLPTFNPDDKPSWLGSWNGAMDTIDQAVGRIEGDIAETGTSIEAAQTAADAAKTAADAAQAAATALQGQVNQNKTDIQSQATMIETLQDDVANIPNLTNISLGRRYGIYRLDSDNPTVGGSEVVYKSARLGWLDVFGYTNIDTGLFSVIQTTIYKPVIEHSTASTGEKQHHIFGYVMGNPFKLSGTNSSDPGGNMLIMGLDVKDTYDHVWNWYATYLSDIDITILSVTGPSNVNMSGCSLVGSTGSAFPSTTIRTRVGHVYSGNPSQSVTPINLS